MAACARPSVRSPAAAPVSLTHWALGLPNAPGVCCATHAAWFVHMWGFRHVQSLSVVQRARLSRHLFSVQRLPSAAVRVLVPVVSGLRVTGNGAWYAPAARSGGQSWLVPVLLGLEQAPLAFAP